MEPLRLLDLFSGIGGFSLGLERSGHFRTVAFCEIEPYPRQVLTKHWPNIPIYEDVCQLSKGRLDADGIRVDAICGGFPCQDISLAGKGEGLEGERSGLWKEYVRLIGELRPRYALIENVSALLGRGLDRVLCDLNALGYDAEWHCIPASFLGAWHERDRIWILAYPKRQRGREGEPEEPILRQSDLSQPLARGFAKWPGRPALPASRFCRGNDGVPARVDRTKCLGNAVVPQIPEIIGHAIRRRDSQISPPSLHHHSIT